MKVSEIISEAKRGEFVQKSITYHEYLVRQIGPFEWTIPHGTKKAFLNLKAAKKYIDTKLTFPAKVSK
jgi:hypothetical protein